MNLKQISTDILIIGGGISGLTTAYFLKDKYKKIMLIDKSTIGNGVTSKTTAKITYLQGIIYQTLEKKFNKSIFKKYFNSQKEAIEILKNIITKNKISCDFEKVDSIIFTLEKSNIPKIKKEKEILQNFGVTVIDVIHNKIEAGIKVEDTYEFNALKYMDNLKNIIKNTISIKENVTANNIIKKDNKYCTHTNIGDIYSKKVIVTCHYPFFLLPTLIPLKTYIKREYINSSIIKQPQKYTAINIDKDLHSIRYYNNYLIYTSNEQRLTSNINYKKNYDKSIQDFKYYFNKEPEYTWMNQDIISNDYLPFIGEIKNDLYIATAFNAWGMTNGTISGKVIYDLIIHKDSPYKELFNPNRNNINLLINSFLGSFHYLKVYIESLFKRNNPYYIKIKGISYGVYKDENNVKHVIKLVCPHMKCNLVFNREEKTWDCPCHGSRFNIDGKLLEGPASKDLKCSVKEKENDI